MCSIPAFWKSVDALCSAKCKSWVYPLGKPIYRRQTEQTRGKTVRIKLLSFLMLPLLMFLFVSVPVKAQGAVISVEPQYNYYGVGENFTVEVRIDNVQNLYAWQVLLTFNSSVLNVLNVTYAPDHILNGNVTVIVVSPVVDNVAGYVLDGACLLGNVAGVSGSGGLFQVTFAVVGHGESTLKIDTEGIVSGGIVSLLLDPSINNIAFTSIDGYHHNHFLGDVTGLNGKPDAVVDMKDIAYLVAQFWTTPKSSNWNPVADVNIDGKVDMRDVATAIHNFGQHFP